MEMNIFSILIVAVMCLLGFGSSIAIIGYMFAVRAKKIYRKVKYGISLYE